MKTKLLAIYLLSVTSMVFGWLDAEVEDFYEGCVNNTPGELSHEKKKRYCACSTDLSTYIWTVDEVIRMIENGTLSKQKDFNTIVNHCAKRIGM